MDQGHDNTMGEDVNVDTSACTSASNSVSTSMFTCMYDKNAPIKPTADSLSSCASLSTAQRSHLTGIPSEIRLLIIELVVRASNSAPRDPGAARSLATPRREANDITYASWSRGEAVLYDGRAHGAKSNVHGLLRANRLLRQQTITVLRRVQGQEWDGWEVDVMVVGNGEIWPTWTRLPFETKVMDKLNVKVRSFGRPVARYLIRERTAGTLPSIGWLMLSFLERLLRVGVCTPSEAENAGGVVDTGEDVEAIRRSQGVMIGELIVDVVSSSVSKRDTAAQPESEEKSFTDLVRETALRPLDQKNKADKSAVEPDELLTILKSQMREMLQVARLPPFHRAAIFERIGIIRFCRDGLLDTTWDLVQMLPLATDDGSSVPRGTFHGLAVNWEQWQKDVCEKRRIAGLSSSPSPRVRTNEQTI